MESEIAHTMTSTDANEGLAADPDDDSAEFAALRYIPKSRFFIWLFISTEVMFFVALIGSYLVIRFGVPPAEWPRPSSFGLMPWVGGINTVILVLSSILVTYAAQAATRQRTVAAKCCLLLGLGLGVAFLAIKFSEYREKYEQGLFPRPVTPLVYSRYDADYLAALRAELQRLRANQAPKQSSELSVETTADQKILDRIQLGLVDWASRQFGQTADPQRQTMIVQSVAQLIRPIPELQTAVKQFLESEQAELIGRERSLAQDRQRLQDELDQSNNRLASLADNPDAATEKSELEKQILEGRNQLAATTTQWSPVADRLAFLATLPELTEGINASYHLRLPVVIPAGRTWLYGYFLLTGAHAAHLLGGILAGLFLVPLRLDASRSVWVGNFAAYWNFVDCVWLVLFPIIYLL